MSTSARRLARLEVRRWGEKNEVTNDLFPERPSSIVMTFYICSNEKLKCLSKLILLINTSQSGFLLQNLKLRGSNENIET